MKSVTLNLTTVFISVASVSVGLLAWLHRQATEQARIGERVNWLCERYAVDHDTSVPWTEPITDGGYPVEAEPDGDASAPHHFYVGIALAAFGFASVWEYYPVTGASMAGIGLIIAADDFLSHTFGVPTPLDLLWKRVIRPIMGVYGD